MTGFADNIYSGLQALTSGQASYAGAGFTRTFRFLGTGGAAQTQQFVLPTGVQNLDAKLFIEVNGTTATTDKITVSAGGTDFHTFTSFGSAQGIVRQTTVSLGTLTSIASACANLSTTAEVSAAITYAGTDTTAVYQVQLFFNRLRVDPLGN